MKTNLSGNLSSARERLCLVENSRSKRWLIFRVVSVGSSTIVVSPYWYVWTIFNDFAESTVAEAQDTTNSAKSYSYHKSDASSPIFFMQCITFLSRDRKCALSRPCHRIHHRLHLRSVLTDNCADSCLDRSASIFLRLSMCSFSSVSPVRLQTNLQCLFECQLAHSSVSLTTALECVDHVRKHTTRRVVELIVWHADICWRSDF